MDLHSQIVENKIVSILRGFTPETVLEVAGALCRGGVRCLEITFDQRGPAERTAEMIELVLSRYGGQLLVGAGTVVTPEQLRLAAEAGARYIISPNCDEEIIRATKEAGLLSMPGAYTPSEIVSAHRWGADIVKVFPADAGGPAYLKAVSAPLSHIPLAAVGGVTLDNLADFLAAGACCLGIGSNLASPRDIQSGNLSALEERARAYVTAARAVQS